LIFFVSFDRSFFNGALLQQSIQKMLQHVIPSLRIVRFHVDLSMNDEFDDQLGQRMKTKRHREEAAEKNETALRLSHDA
jgi:hypothetical protein